jgi:hypothetical protein
MSSDQRLYSSIVRESKLAPCRVHVLGCCVLSLMLPNVRVYDSTARSFRSPLCGYKRRMNGKIIVMLRLAVPEKASMRAG